MKNYNANYGKKILLTIVLFKIQNLYYPTKVVMKLSQTVIKSKERLRSRMGHGVRKDAHGRLRTLQIFGNFRKKQNFHFLKMSKIMFFVKFDLGFGKSIGHKGGKLNSD